MTPWCGRIRAHTHVLKSLKSLSVGHLISLKDVGSVKSMRSCLVAYVKHF